MIKFETKDYWKALILYGLNQATYKIALGKTLLNLCDQGYTDVPWDVFSKEFLGKETVGKKRGQIFILDYSDENNGVRLSIAPCPNVNV
jgi:hypothetical protein